MSEGEYRIAGLIERLSQLLMAIEFEEIPLIAVHSVNLNSCKFQGH